MRRIALLAALVASLFAFAVPVAADTTPGGPGTNFFSSSGTCSPQGARTTCTETDVSTFTDASGTQMCLNIFTYAVGAHGRFVYSTTGGCSSVTTFSIAPDNSVTLTPTTISLSTCRGHRCVHPTNYTVSAYDSPTGDPPTTTTTVTTTTTGSCTTITTTTDVSTPLSGTITVNGTTISETGVIDTTTEVSSPPC